MKKQLKYRVVHYLKNNGLSSSKQVFDGIDGVVGYATVKRALGSMVTEGWVDTYGKGKSTRYQLKPGFDIWVEIDLEQYFEKDALDRDIIAHYNFELLEHLRDNQNLFTTTELETLQNGQSKFTRQIQQLSRGQFQTEFERLAIDLSWKSSQIEGNTYSLLETERLLVMQQTASGKTKDEAVMLLNHKTALDFIFEHIHYVQPLTVSAIEDIHKLLTSELKVKPNIRNRRVGITGTRYIPLDNEFQIREALQGMCDLVNGKSNVFEKALLVLLLISYIQPFDDGNKRTARIISNAILMNHHHCPLSFRTVDPIDYKKAMLLFYEKNNVSAFKKIFIEQYGFAVKHYF
jgi:prophage maintenance system killer protein/predicted transcriptional regulator